MVIGPKNSDCREQTDERRRAQARVGAQIDHDHALKESHVRVPVMPANRGMKRKTPNINSSDDAKGKKQKLEEK